jgi:hypothetical protein
VTLPQPIQFTTDDGFRTEIAELPDQSLRLIVTRGERSWTGHVAKVEQAILLGKRIRSEVGAGEVPPSGDPGGERDPDVSAG